MSFVSGKQEEIIRQELKLAHEINVTLRADRDRLRDEIRKAPHEPNCDSHAQFSPDCELIQRSDEKRCNCFKRTALGGE